MNLNNLSDEELMGLYQIGEEGAFHILYKRHSGKILGFLRSKVRNLERANELFQEVFIKIHKSKHLYNKTLPALPWIFSVTRSVLIDGLRSDRRQIVTTELTETTELAQEQPPTSENINSLIDNLPPTQKQAVELRYVNEKTFDEIASILQTSPVNVRKIISRAIAKLKSFSEKGENA